MPRGRFEGRQGGERGQAIVAVDHRCSDLLWHRGGFSNFIGTALVLRWMQMYLSCLSSLVAVISVRACHGFGPGMPRLPGRIYRMEGEPLHHQDRLDVDLFMMIPHGLITQENYKSYFDR